MIVYTLACSASHEFEAWFKDAAAFKSQRRARKVACPVCGGTDVDRRPSAPRIGKGAAAADPAVPREGAAPGDARAAAFRETLERLHRHVAEQCDYVGDRFAEEARKIHYGETEERNIYGETTDDEARELAEEGVPFARIPRPPRHNA